MNKPGEENSLADQTAQNEIEIARVETLLCAGRVDEATQPLARLLSSEPRPNPRLAGIKQRAKILLMAARYHALKAEWDQARDYAERSLALAKSVNDRGAAESASQVLELRSKAGL